MNKAIIQRKVKEYLQKFIGKHETILSVEICYDSKIKERRCKIENIKFNKQ